MQIDISKREIFYLFPLLAIMLDWGSTVIVSLHQGEFNEVNPLARAMGLEGAICYALFFGITICVILYKWGLQYEANGSKWIMLTDCLAIMVTLQGFTAYLGNFGYVPIIDYFGTTLALGLVTLLGASITSFIINYNTIFTYKR